MNKEDLVKLVSEKTGITQKAAEQAQKVIIEGISSTLEKGDSISLVGFGSFKVVERAAREGRNPSTGEKMQIPASKAVKFTPSKSLTARSGAKLATHDNERIRRRGGFQRKGYLPSPKSLKNQSRFPQLQLSRPLSEGAGKVLMLPL